MQRSSLLLLVGAVLAACLLLTGCGADGETKAPAAPAPGQSEIEESEVPGFGELDDSKSTSARFTGKEVFTLDGIEDVMRVSGAFDWRTNTGWAAQESEVYSTELIQIGAACYRREPPGMWTESPADDVDGLCDAALLSNPATEFQLMSLVGDDKMVTVGQEKIEGDLVTHYQGHFSLHSDTSQVDYWIDENGIVRRSLTVDTKGGFEITRDYLDLGLDVHVQAPTSPDAKLEDLVG